MRDIVKDAATLTVAKQYEAAHYSAEQFVSTYTNSREERNELIEFLADMEMIYKMYPKDEWLHYDYNADPTVEWQRD